MNTSTTNEPISTHTLKHHQLFCRQFPKHDQIPSDGLSFRQILLTFRVFVLFSFRFRIFCLWKKFFKLSKNALAFFNIFEMFSHKTQGHRHALQWHDAVPHLYGRSPRNNWYAYNICSRGSKICFICRFYFVCYCYCCYCYWLQVVLLLLSIVVFVFHLRKLLLLVCYGIYG